MSTYLIAREIAITRQEGDTADVVITVPALLDMAGKTARFQVRDTNNRVIINKVGDDVAINGQVIAMALAKAETLHHDGKHRWELKIFNADGGQVTSGKGAFIIIKTDP